MLLNKRCMDKTEEMEYPKAGYQTMDMPMNCCPEQYPGVMCDPIYECPQIRVCHRQICHEVPHIVPVETKIVNHHIYRHTYTPCYTCSEENEVCNVYDKPSC